MKTLTLLVSILFIHVTTPLSNNETIKEEKRTVGTFEGISVAGPYKVSLIEGAEGEITLKGSDDDLAITETKIKNNVLIIKSKETSWLKKWRFGPVEIIIPVEKVSKLVMSGSGYIQSNFTLKAKEFKSVVTGSGEITTELSTEEFSGLITGSGNIEVSGEATSTSVKITGSGDYHGRRLNSMDTEVNITGSGKADVQAEESLDVVITGSGNVHCFGNPKKQKSRVSGSGKVSINR